MKSSILKKLLSAVTITALVAGMLAGCGAASGGGSGKKILFVGHSITGDTFAEQLAAALTNNASAEGVTIEMTENPTVSQQMDTIAGAASAGYDAVIMRVVDGSTALQAEVAAGDVPIVFVNAKPDAERLSPDQYVYVGSEPLEAGRQQGEAVLAKLGDPSKLNIVIMEGPAGSYDAVNRTGGVKQVMKEHGVDATYVFDDTANWRTDEAKANMDIFLQTGQPFDAIFTNNDSMALGVIQSLKEHNLNPADTPIAAVDGTADGCAAIESGDMVFTAFQNADAQALYALKAAKLLAEGKSIATLEGATEDKTCVVIPFEGIDSSNVSQYK